VAVALGTDVVKVNVLPILVVVHEVFAYTAVAPTADGSTTVFFTVLK
jgi:hypothetical protein